jgi:hypothetical protein
MLCSSALAVGLLACLHPKFAVLDLPYFCRSKVRVFLSSQIHHLPAMANTVASFNSSPRRTAENSKAPPAPWLNLATKLKPATLWVLKPNLKSREKQQIIAPLGDQCFHVPDHIVRMHLQEASSPHRDILSAVQQRPLITSEAKTNSFKGAHFFHSAVVSSTVITNHEEERRVCRRSRVVAVWSQAPGESVLFCW